MEHGAIILPENRTTFNVQASYTCHENYTLIGNENRTCLEDGEFFYFYLNMEILEFSWPFADHFYRFTF